MSVAVSEAFVVPLEGFMDNSTGFAALMSNGMALDFWPMFCTKALNVPIPRVWVWVEESSAESVELDTKVTEGFTVMVALALEMASVELALKFVPLTVNNVSFPMLAKEGVIVLSVGGVTLVMAKGRAFDETLPCKMVTFQVLGLAVSVALSEAVSVDALTRAVFFVITFNGFTLFVNTARSPALNPLPVNVTVPLKPA